uniref:E3 ubiquitin-protein ligase listerin n=1 Tax=Rhabditophanes sp. KR3021 TaxID=114890 RepID=A0AC35U8V6_9BILA
MNKSHIPTKLKTSSSARAAASLQSRGFTTKTFVGFNNVVDPTLYDESDFIIESLDESFSHELKVILKKIEKKDTATKEKGLKELEEVVMDSTEDGIKKIFGVYVLMFPKLVVHSSPIIRSACISIATTFIAIMQKDAGKYLKIIVPYVIFACSDGSGQVTRAGRYLICKCFPDKKEQLYVKFKSDIDDLCLSMITKSHKLIAPQKFTEEETNKQREDRLTAQSLATLAESLPFFKDEAYNLMLVQKFADVTIINHMNGLPNNVKAPYLHLIGKLCDSDVEAFIPTKLASIVLSNLDNEDLAVSKTGMECFLKMAQKDSYFEKIDIEKAIVPKIVRILRTCVTNWRNFSSNLLPLFDMIYKRLSDKKFYFLSTILDSLLERELAKVTSDHFMDSIAEIFKYSLIHNQGNGETLSYLIEYLVKIVNYSFTSDNGKIIKTITDLCVWVEKKNFLQESDHDGLMVQLVDIIVNNIDHTKKFAMEIYNVTQNEQFKTLLCSSKKLPTDFYLLLTENSKECSLEAHGISLTESFSNTNDPTTRVMIFQKLLKSLHDMTMEERIKTVKDFGIDQTLTALAFLQSIDSTNVSLFNPEFYNECFVKVVDQIKNKSVNVLSLESITFIYKYAEPTNIEKLINVLKDMPNEQALAVMLDVLTEVNHFNDDQDTLSEMLFKSFLNVKKTLSSETVIKFVHFMKPLSKNDKQLSQVYNTFLQNKKIARIDEIAENVKQIHELTDLPFLFNQHEFESICERLNKTFFSTLIYASKRGKQNYKFSADSAILDLIEFKNEHKRVVLMEAMLVNANDDERIVRSFAYVAAFKKLLSVLDSLSLMKDEMYSDNEIIEQWRDNEVKVSEFISANYSTNAFLDAITLNEDDKDYLNSGNVKELFTFDEELEDGLAVEDWQSWIFLGNRKMVQIKSLIYIFKIFLKDAHEFGNVKQNDEDDFRVCGLISFFSESCALFKEMLQDEDDEYFQYYRVAFALACDIISIRQRAALQYIKVTEKCIEVEEWDFISKTVFNPIFECFGKISRKDYYFYQRYMYLTKSVCYGLMETLSCVNVDEILQVDKEQEFEAVKDHTLVFAANIQNKVSPHIQIAASHLLHTVLPLYFSYENKSVIARFNEEEKLDLDGPIDENMATAVLPPIILAMIRMIDLDDLKKEHSQDLDSFKYIPLPLILWNCLIYFFRILDSTERSFYLEALDNEIVTVGLAATLNYLPEVPYNKDNLNTCKFRQPPIMRIKDTDDYISASNYACYVFYQTLQTIPVSVRHWFSLLPNASRKPLDELVEKYFSPIIIQEELKNSLGYVDEDSRKMVIKVYPTIKTIEATYEVEYGSSMVISIVFPRDYPLSIPSINTEKTIATKQVTKKWLMHITTYLSNQNGLTISGLCEWKKNIEKHLEGVDECSICMMTVNSVNHRLPRVVCKQCKHKFHSQCLYKWFSTSSNSTCPLCRADYLN